jgi:transcriptional regulator with XRE-family HTH domain
METDLNKWVIEKLRLHNWSMRKLGQVIGVHHSQISRVLSGKQSAKIDFYLAIANAFDAVPELLKAAGLFEGGIGSEELTFAQLLAIIKQLPSADQEEILEYALYRLWRHQKQT